MATMQHKIFCIREFIKTESATAVRRAFRFRFNIQPPTSSSTLAPGCSTFSEWISTSTMDRSRRERRPGTSVPSPEFSWSHTLRLFLVGVHKRSSLCTISTNSFGRPKKPYHNCGELGDARHSSLGVERIQLPSICYPCGRRGGHIEHL